MIIKKNREQLLKSMQKLTLTNIKQSEGRTFVRCIYRV